MAESKPGAKRRALARILELPRLAVIVPQLSAEILHRVIQTCGLEDCGELVALATPQQLVRMLDLDLWRPERPGHEEGFDAARFGVWLDVLVDLGASTAVQRLVDIDVDLVIAGFAQHVRVFDAAAIADHVTTDGECISRPRVDDRLTATVGGYVVVARRADAWDAVTAALTALEAEHPDRFHRIMTHVRAVSNDGFEIDGLHDLLTDTDQVMFDVGTGREFRREPLGYVSVGDARAFLELSRRARVGTGLPRPTAVGARAVVPDKGVKTERAAEATTVVVDILLDAGILDPRPRALLAASPQQSPRLARIQNQMQVVFDRDPAAYLARTEEIGYLANTLVAGCSIQGRSFSLQEAWDAAAATINLGLERLDAADGFLVDHDTIGVFQTGWTSLHDDVAMYAADRLVAVLADLRCGDRATRSDLERLRREMTTHMRAGRPWRARQAMEVLAMLDMPAWAALLGFIDECPVLHGVVTASHRSTNGAVSATAFEFIAEEAQILAAAAFLDSLGATLQTP